MKRWLILGSGVVLAVSLTWLRGPAAESDPGLRLLQSGPRGVTFEFVPEVVTFDTVTVAGRTYVRPSFLDATYDETPGQPQLPRRVVVVGIPPGSRVTAAVIEREESERETLPILPFPALKVVEGVAEEDYESVRGLEPEERELVEVEPPAWFRDQQIVRVVLTPFRYDRERGRLRMATRLVVRVTFSGETLGGQENTSFTVRTREDDFYSGVILNAEQARAWRRTPSRSLKKRGSFFQQGTWYKFRIREEGIYRITGRTLQESGIDLSAIDPKTVRVYNNGGRELPRDIRVARPDSLIENAIVVVDGGDNRFDPDDYIVLYGRGVEGWEFDTDQQRYSHYINHYTYDNVYWLTWGERQGKRMAKVSVSPVGSAPVRTTFRDRVFVEEELNNLFHSGYEPWLGWQFSADPISQKRAYRLNLPDAVAADTAQFRFRLFAGTSGVHVFSVFVNGVPLSGYSFAGKFASRIFESSGANLLQPGENEIELRYTPGSEITQAYLDWFEVSFSRGLVARDNELFFYGSSGSGLTTYQVSGLATGTVWLLDVSDFANVKQLVDFANSGGTVRFTDQAAGLPAKRYAAITDAAFRDVTALELDAPSDLRNPANGASYVIITHEDFYSEALRLADHRASRPGEEALTTYVAKIQDVYDEFAAGMFDPTAIRDFLKYAFENWSERPRYVLLFGDGDFDHRNILSDADKNWIPTYQTTDLSLINNRTTDSWFTYVSGNDRVMDMAIGRLNTQTPAEARVVVDKIINYESNPIYGTWRNIITIVADDELVTGGVGNEIIHTQQSETLAENYTPRWFDVRKIYLTEYPKVLSASISGVRKPGVNRDLIKQINDGTLIVNYIGHGNSRLWAHERIFTQTVDLPKVQNGDKLAFYVAATCDWALFDNPVEQSMGEEIILAEGRGAIGVLSSARLVFSFSNAQFNYIFYSNLFTSQGRTARLGDAFLRTRLSTTNPTNDEKFHIYGDPALRLAVPQNRVVITRIEPDSIRALSIMTVKGQVQVGVTPAANYVGKVELRAFDSRKYVTYITDAGSRLNYFLPGNAIFRGSAPVSAGQFEVKFIVPKEITYGGLQGRISAYVWNESSDGSGYLDSLPVGGTVTQFVDNEGPQIRIYFRGREDFSSGDIVSPGAVLVAAVADSISGVNITGEIGHKITLTLDGDVSSRIDVTDRFSYDEGSFVRGTLEFPLPELAEGPHTVEIKAWDNFNNSSVASAEFIIMPEDEVVLRNVLNYPNPLTDRTTFTFEINKEAVVEIKIYTLSGRLIRTLRDIQARGGFNMIEWDGLDQDGDLLANGVYLYRVVARSQAADGKGLTGESIGKLVVQR
jgi:hypothetical protein